jgi:hypothetical protein
VPDHRRDRVPGGTFFFTANLLDRRSDLLATQIDALRDAIRQARARAPFVNAAGLLLSGRLSDAGPFTGSTARVRAGIRNSSRLPTRGKSAGFRLENCRSNSEAL